MDIDKLEALGWIVESESPLEIRHEDGSFATGNAAKMVYSSLVDTEDNTKEFAISELNKLLIKTTEYIDNASAYSNEDSDNHYKYWEVAYSLIFNDDTSKKIYKHLKTLNIDLDYYDPDTSYEEDVRAFYNAFNHSMNIINQVTKPKIKSGF